ncbi:MAG: hypothetical protein AW10_02248 [Candidatus Accumulibacter appositus]|uniref:Uncharacterized protein n=1 Tax=Candidatus Accumulibacter appositus TaxID=1454003 RepID=A0A011NAT1_9PROT|nr:hypothetical protein [Accumulibacter sp.]EXI79763.1 MAG: hypothetical protein AW10_02248 [Candidatus Accumulibacter appositus]HRF05180.1 hypothetical protein [Accumulibacter sp.]
MATMNFSIPDDVKERFNATFAKQNKSAIITRFIEEAIARAERKERSDAAIDRILARLDQRTPVSEDAVRESREEGRP